MYNYLTQNGTKEFTPLEFKETILSEHNNWLLNDSDDVMKVALSQAQLDIVREHFGELIAIGSKEEIISSIYKLSMTKQVSWNEYTLEDLWTLIQNISAIHADPNVDHLLLYVDLSESEEDISIDKHLNNELETVIPSTLSVLRADFRRLVMDLEAVVSEEASDALSTWFKDLLKFGDNFAIQVI